MKSSINQDKATLIQSVLDTIDPSAHTRGDYYLKKSREDIGYTIDFTIESLKANDLTILKNYYRWLIDTLEPYGIKPPILFAMFDALKTALRPYLSTEEKNLLMSLSKEDVAAYIANNKDNIKPLDALAKPFLDAILDKNRQQASQYIHALLDSGTELKKIYLEIIQSSMIEVGRLWQARKINVADEHMATVITQYVLTELYPYIFSSEKNGKKIAALALGSELHEIGIRMVADFFELSGFESHYLGANMPTSGVIDFLKDTKVDLIAVSVTIASHLSTLQTLIDVIRDDNELASIKILIGGQAIAQMNDPVTHFGADGFARDAEGAVKEGEALVNNVK